MFLENQKERPDRSDLRIYVLRENRRTYPRLKRARFANQRVEIFKPLVDVRYSQEEVVSTTVTPFLNSRRLGRKHPSAGT